MDVWKRGPIWQQNCFRVLRDSSLNTARAWGFKEFVRGLWHYSSHAWAANGWAYRLSWTVHSRLELVKKTDATSDKHLWGIINAIVLKMYNGHTESINRRIQRMKGRTRSFHARERCRNANYFHLGGLGPIPTSGGESMT